MHPGVLLGLFAFVVVSLAIAGAIEAMHRANAHASEEIAERTRAEAEIARLNRELQSRVTELQTILNVLPLGIALAEDPACKRISANPYLNQLLGIPQGANAALQAIPGHTACYADHQDGRELPPEELPMQIACRGKEVRELELDLVRAGQSTRRLLCSARPVFDDQGRIRGAVGAFLDITHRKQVEEALRDAKEELGRANQDLERKVHARTAHLNETIRSLERICYNIAHDLRGPNRTMQGFAEVLMTEYASSLEPAAREYLSRIANAAERNDSLILDLLAYGRLGHVDLPCSRQSLRTQISGVVEKLAGDVAACNAKVSIREPLPDVWANPVALEQALANLFSNAVKFVTRGVRPEVTIWAEEADSRVRVCVQDNGIGIPSIHHEKIFGLFERLHSESDFPGTGIGLAIVQKSIERMGGRVGVDSAPGKGSRFWFELPKPAASN
jgi:signal transduction histidine kinase